MPAKPEQWRTVAERAPDGATADFLHEVWAGALSDRYGKPCRLLGSDLAAAGALVTVPVAAVVGVLTIGQLYVILFLLGAARVVHDAAAISLLPSVVAPHRRHQADSRVGAASSVPISAGYRPLTPGIAGALALVLEAPTVLAIDALLQVVPVVLLLASPYALCGPCPPRPPPRPCRPPERGHHDHRRVHLGVFAHPDGESLLAGGVLAPRAAASPGRTPVRPGRRC